MQEPRRPTEFMARLLGAGDLPAIARYYAHIEDADELTEATHAFARNADLVFAVLRQPGLEDHDLGRLCSRYHLHLLPQMRQDGILNDPESLLEAIHQRLFAAVRNTPALARDTEHWLVHCRCLGDFCAATGELVRARDWYKQAVATAEALGGNDTEAESSIRRVVPLLDRLGEMYAALGDPARALDRYALALSHRERLEEREVWPGLARVGDLYLALGRPTQALTYYQRLVTARTRRLEEVPADTENALGLAVAQRAVGELLWAAGQVCQALDAFERALSAVEGLYQQIPDDGACARELVTCLWRLAEASWALDDLTQAEQHYRRWIEVAEVLARREDGPSEDARLFLKGLNGLGELHKSLGEAEQALVILKRALAVAEDLAERNPDRFEDGRELCYSLMRVGELHSALGRLTLSADCMQRVHVLWQRLAPQSEHPQYLRDLETVYYDPAHFGQPAESVGEAQAYWRKCHETLRTLAHEGKHLDDEAQKVLARLDYAVQGHALPAEQRGDEAGPAASGMWTSGQGQLARLDPKLKASIVAGSPDGGDAPAIQDPPAVGFESGVRSDNVSIPFDQAGEDIDAPEDWIWARRMQGAAALLLFILLAMMTCVGLVKWLGALLGLP